MKKGKKDWKSTIAGLITGAALGYAGYKSGNYELILAGISAAGLGTVAKDSVNANSSP